MAQQLSIPFLGRVPVDVKFGELVEGKVEVDSEDEDEEDEEEMGKQDEAPAEPDTRPLVERYQEGWSYPRFEEFAQTIIGNVQATAGAS